LPTSRRISPNQVVWDLGALDRDKHVMPWRIEDELRKLGANFIQAGLWKGFAIRDGNLVTGPAELQRRRGRRCDPRGGRAMRNALREASTASHRSSRPCERLMDDLGDGLRLEQLRAVEAPGGYTRRGPRREVLDALGE
jgi:hypothetical protein